MALNDQLWRLAMSLKRCGSDSTGKAEVEAGRGSSRDDGSFGAEEVDAS